MIRTETSMSLEHFHDFYYLEALKAAITSRPDYQFSHSMARLAQDVDYAIDEIVPNLAYRALVYLYAVCYGEARHARDDEARDRFLPSTLEMNRSDCYSKITMFPPTRENIAALVDIYSQDWKSGYGGKAWLGIAEALVLYGKVSDAAFIDHIIDLEHNGGTAFNKEDAKYSLYFYAQYPSDFKSFLDWKFSEDILTRPPQFVHKIHLTPRVYKLVRRYETIVRNPVAYWLEGRLTTLTAYNVEWGEAKLTTECKWFPWVATHNGNRPTGSKLFELSDIENIPYYTMTEAQLRKTVKKLRNSIIKKVKPYMTKVLRESLDKKVENWLEYALKNAMTPKKKIQYTVIPVQACVTEFSAKLKVLIPSQGTLNETEYGFDIEAQTTQMGDGTWKFGHVTKILSKAYLQIDNAKILITNKELEAYLA